jgi:hypothetical protein
MIVVQRTQQRIHVAGVLGTPPAERRERSLPNFGPSTASRTAGAHCERWAQKGGTMTAQISDTFIFKGDRYSLIGMKGGDLAVPEQFGMEAEMIHTACYCGFYATYECTEEALYLRELTLREKNGNYLPIGGTKPAKEAYQATYHGLSVVIPFTGKIRLAKDFIQEFYIHMGYQKASAFKTVLDVTLKDGRVVETKDRSQEMEQKRGAFKKHYESGNMAQTIEEAFSLDMDLQ